jgi:hypothetical protein
MVLGDEGEGDTSYEFATGSMNLHQQKEGTTFGDPYVMKCKQLICRMVKNLAASFAKGSTTAPRFQSY